ERAGAAGASRLPTCGMSGFPEKCECYTVTESPPQVARIAGAIAWRHAALAQSVLAFDLGQGQAADARQWPPGIRHSHRHHDLIGTWRVADAHLHPVEVAAYIGGILLTHCTTPSPP